jgi:serine/threonine protein kinase/Tol biopolymer transport system component
MIGTTISHYRVLREIGSGGMGVVYEAEDLTLGRRVALKFLPDELAGNDAARERFLREARASSALNHQNICTIYAVEQEAGRHFIAMEMLDGEPLDRRLRGPSMPFDSILDIAIQTADALDAAHQAGIIHRDIKPGNIFVTRSGRVKVLDFGLAKFAKGVVARGVSADGATLDRLDSHLTSPGSAVGTVAYMSPEQARGEELDTRSDLFSFGAVLYQMGTGALPFEGPTSAVIFSAILKENPTAPRERNPALPPRLAEVIERALEKDRDLRYQSAAEMRSELKRLKRDTSSRTSTVAAPSSAQESAAPAVARAPSSGAVVLAEAKRHKGKLVAAVIIGVAVIAAISIVAARWITRPVKVTVNPQTMTMAKITDDGRTLSASISPDGRYIAIVQTDGENQSLHVRQLATGADVEVVPPLPGAFGSASFTPDGNYVYYLHTDKDDPDLWVVYSVPSLGGKPRRVLANSNSAVAFSPDGTQMAFVRFGGQTELKQDQVLIAKSDGTSEKVVLSRAAYDSALATAPAWSNDGNLLAVGATQAGENQGRLLVFTPAGKEVAAFAYDTLPQAVGWSPDGSGIFVALGHFRNLQLAFQPYPKGELLRLTRDLDNYLPSGNGFNLPTLSLTADGKSLVAVREQIFANVFVGDVTEGSLKNDLKAITTDQANGLWLSWTADNKLVASDFNARAYLMNADGSDRARIAERGGRMPFVAGCGSDAVVASMSVGAKLQLFKVALAGGEPEQLTNGADDEVGGCTPDGKWAVYYSIDRGTAHINKVSLQGGKPIELAAGALFMPFVSPDGRLVAYTRLTGKGNQQKHEFVVQSIEGGPPLYTVSGDRGRGASSWIGVVAIGWTPDSKGLLLVERTGTAQNLFRVNLDGTASVQLTHFDSEPFNIWLAAFSPDGKKIAITRERANTSDAVLFTNFR